MFGCIRIESSRKDLLTQNLRNQIRYQLGCGRFYDIVIYHSGFPVFILNGRQINRQVSFTQQLLYSHRSEMMINQLHPVDVLLQKKFHQQSGQRISFIVRRLICQSLIAPLRKKS